MCRDCQVTPNVFGTGRLTAVPASQRLTRGKIAGWDFNIIRTWVKVIKQIKAVYVRDIRANHLSGFGNAVGIAITI